MPLTVSTGGGLAAPGETAGAEEADDCIEALTRAPNDQELQSDAGRRWIFFSAA
jgi:hypothetical protein